VYGLFEAVGDVILENGALFEGELIAGGRLIIEEGAELRGELKSKSLQVAGRLLCGIADTGPCLLQATAVVQGDIRSTKMLINEGATFIGKHEQKRS
jgi:cytoskeletal protein CcmA (bactofilin family)